MKKDPPYLPQFVDDLGPSNLLTLAVSSTVNNIVKYPHRMTCFHS